MDTAPSWLVLMRVLGPVQRSAATAGHSGLDTAPAAGRSLRLKSREMGDLTRYKYLLAALLEVLLIGLRELLGLRNLNAQKLPGLLVNNSAVSSVNTARVGSGG